MKVPLSLCQLLQKFSPERERCRIMDVKSFVMFYVCITFAFPSSLLLRSNKYTTNEHRLSYILQLHPFYTSKCTPFISLKLIFMSFEMSKFNFELLRQLLDSLKLLETFQILNIKCWKHSSQSEGDGNLVLSNFHIYQRIPIETLELNTEIGNWISISAGKTLTAIFLLSIQYFPWNSPNEWQPKLKSPQPQPTLN